MELYSFSNKVKKFCNIFKSSLLFFCISKSSIFLLLSMTKLIFPFIFIISLIIFCNLINNLFFSNLKELYFLFISLTIDSSKKLINSSFFFLMNNSKLFIESKLRNNKSNSSFFSFSFSCLRFEIFSSHIILIFFLIEFICCIRKDIFICKEEKYFFK